MEKTQSGISRGRVSTKELWLTARSRLEDIGRGVACCLSEVGLNNDWKLQGIAVLTGPY